MPGVGNILSAWALRNWNSCMRLREKVPSNWMEAKDDRLIKAPGYVKNGKFIFYDAPSGAPFKAVMLERANQVREVQNIKIFYAKKFPPLMSREI